MAKSKLEPWPGPIPVLIEVAAVAPTRALVSEPL